VKRSRGRPRHHFSSMKKQIGLALAAAAIAIGSALPALAKSSWVSLGQSTDGVRMWALKHNWDGRFRTYGSRNIYANGKESAFLKVADCSNWQYRFKDESRWRPVLQGTMDDASLSYVCN